MSIYLNLSKKAVLLFRTYLFSSLLLCTYSQANDSLKNVPPKKIQWLLNDAPPFFVLSGEHKNQGICDITLNYLIKALPEIEHEELVLPHTRLGKVLDDGAMACFPCMIKRGSGTARAIFSNPTVVYPPHVLVATDNFFHENEFHHLNNISLQDLLRNNDFIMAKHGGRKFGNVLDELLLKYSDKADELILRNEGKSTTSILEMLRLGRADFSIEYPAIVNFYNFKQTEPLQTIKINENRDTPVAGAIGCSASAPDNFAQRALLEINSALTHIVIDKTYQQHVSQWFSTDENYNNWYQQLVISGNEASGN